MSLDEAIEAFRAAKKTYDECIDSYEAARENLDRAKGRAEKAGAAYMEAERDYYAAVADYAEKRGTPLPPSPAAFDMRRF